MDSRTLEKGLRKLEEYDHTYNMPRENKFNIGKEKLRQLGNIGSKVRLYQKWD